MDGQNLLYWQERIDLAAAFRWTARLNMHEAVANHFSLSVNDDGTQFLMNPNQKHFSRPLLGFQSEEYLVVREKLVLNHARRNHEQRNNFFFLQKTVWYVQYHRL